MSPRKQSDNDAFISISKEEFFDSFTAVRDAVTKLTTAIATPTGPSALFAIALNEQ